MKRFLLVEKPKLEFMKQNFNFSILLWAIVLFKKEKSQNFYVIALCIWFTNKYVLC
jgi:hypothetical protein